MRLSHEKYTQALTQLLPQGDAWKGETLHQLIKAWAAEFKRFDARMNDLLDESDPRNANELLPDYERMLNLPGPCVASLSPTQQARVRSVINILKRKAPITQNDLMDVAQSLGITIIIDDIRPAYFGQARFGITPIYNQMARWFLMIKSNDDIRILKCMLSDLVLADRQVVFSEVA